MCSDGKKRKAEEYQCLYCKNTFLKRKRKNRAYKFCSEKCQYDYTHIECECAQCHKVFQRKKSSLFKSKSRLYFCSRACKDTAQKLDGIKEIHPSHYHTGTGRTTYRNKFDESELFCRRCGYKEFSCSVEIHHKDHDRDNNNNENLIPLCSNCHNGYHAGHITKEEIYSL
jgi:endogenous inhibitor of DNA gyrase (YacG/DUF329 family)